MSRFTFPREFYIPKGSLRVADRAGLVTVYVYSTSKGKPAAMAFLGKAAKPLWHRIYRSAEQREKDVRELMEGQRKHAEFKAQRRAASNGGHTFKVGDAVVNSWGYDQTNVDFYRVVRTSKVYVWLQKIGGMAVPSKDGFSSMSGHTVPDLSSEGTGEPEQHKAHGDSIVFRHGCGRKWDGKPVFESWYA